MNTLKRRVKALLDVTRHSSSFSLFHSHQLWTRILQCKDEIENDSNTNLKSTTFTFHFPFIPLQHSTQNHLDNCKRIKAVKWFEWNKLMFDLTERKRFKKHNFASITSKCDASKVHQCTMDNPLEIFSHKSWKVRFTRKIRFTNIHHFYCFFMWKCECFLYESVGFFELLLRITAIAMLKFWSFCWEKKRKF